MKDSMLLFLEVLSGFSEVCKKVVVRQHSKQYDKLFVLLINKNIKKARFFFVVFDPIRKITAYLDQKLENCLYIYINFIFTAR